MKCFAQIDSKAPLDKACLCACGIPTGYGAAVKAVNIRPGDSVAVWGVGGVGLASVVGCKQKQAGKIIGVAASTFKEPIGNCDFFITVLGDSKAFKFYF